MIEFVISRYVIEQFMPKQEIFLEERSYTEESTRYQEILRLVLDHFMLDMERI